MESKAFPELIDVGPENIDETGFFCYMSKKKTEGYQRKLAWLKNRFSEGMRIKMLTLPERGFKVPCRHCLDAFFHLKAGHAQDFSKRVRYPG